MRTEFSAQQLQSPAVAEIDSILRKCVHCGFCNATCPTYGLTGDELDGPRGRIYLMKNMLESEASPSTDVVRHIDRCLSCLSCMSTCPSGVDYMHLVDHARTRIERKYKRTFSERSLRQLLATSLPFPGRFRMLVRTARLFSWCSFLLPSRLTGINRCGSSCLAMKSNRFAASM